MLFVSTWPDISIESVVLVLFVNLPVDVLYTQAIASFEFAMSRVSYVTVVGVLGAAGLALDK